MRLVLARPVQEDAKKVMEWRNDPDSLRFSNDTAPKKWPEFFEEFRSEYFSHPILPPLFVYKEGEPVAFFRFRPDPEGAEVSVMVAPEKRGEGIGKEALALLISWVEKRGVQALIAEVKEENQASLHLFSGFEKIAPNRFRHRFRETRKKVFIIAEAGSNWKAGNPLETGRRMIEVAKEAGADAIKFQVFKAKTTYVESSKEIFSLFEWLEMPDEILQKFAEWVKEAGLEFMASVFSSEDLRRVDPFVKRHKIASYEITHLPLIREVAKTGKPLYLSTGAATPRDIALAVEAFGKGDLTLLQCTAKYPAPLGALELRVIPWLAATFGKPAGFSDHSRSLIAPAAAVALGATAIEKHFTLDRNLEGPDQAFAINPDELKQLIQAIRETEEALGTGAKRVLPEEEELFHFAQRRLQAAADIKKGEPIHLDILRPGTSSQGAHPIHFDKIEGKRAARDLKKGEGVTLDDLLA